MARTTGDVVVKLLERELKDAKDSLKLGKDNNAPNLKDLEQAVEDAQKRLDKFNESSGSDRKRLNEKYLGDYYEKVGDWVRDLVKQFPQLTNLFSKAINNNWDSTKFLNELYKSDWWTEQAKKGRGSVWLETFMMENDPSQQGKWIDTVDAVKQKIRDLADSIYDMQIDEGELDKIARRYLYQGWDQSDERGLRVWLSRQFGKQSTAEEDPLQPGGALLDTQRTLEQALKNFGITRADRNWASKTAQDILNPESGVTADDVWNNLIAEAESLYPVFAGKLNKDYSVRDAGAGYLSQMYRYLELDNPDSIDLTDPLLQRAFTSLDDAGNPTLMPLWKFNQEIKKDDRWQYTTNALSTYSQIGSDLARMMGFVG